MRYLKTLTAAALLLGSGLGAAVELSIVPSLASVQQGSNVSVDLVASDLGSSSLGAFLAEIAFDDAILDFDSVVYGNLLGDPTDPLETDILTSTGVGLVSLDELSWLSVAALDALQPSSFTLATLTFSGQAVGTSALSFGNLDLSDALGNTLVPTALTGGGIQVNPAPPSGAPAPATAALILPFALLLARRRRTDRAG